MIDIEQTVKNGANEKEDTYKKIGTTLFDKNWQWFWTFRHFRIAQYICFKIRPKYVW
jgi:hypothetical protein